MKRLLLSLAVLFAATLSAHAQAPVQDVRVVLHTDKGDIDGTIFASKVPVTAANFLNLAQQKFYDGLTFHRVIANFMIQGGDPKGTGGGDPGYKFEDEKGGPTTFDKPGIFAMANSGPNTNGSQFFITHVPTPWLNGHHTIFGQVNDAKSQEVVNKIAQGDHIKSIEVLGDTAPLFAAQKERVDKFNAQLIHPPKR